MPRKNKYFCSEKFLYLIAERGMEKNDFIYAFKNKRDIIFDSAKNSCNRWIKSSKISDSDLLAVSEILNVQPIYFRNDEDKIPKSEYSKYPYVSDVSFSRYMDAKESGDIIQQYLMMTGFGDSVWSDPLTKTKRNQNKNNAVTLALFRIGKVIHESYIQYKYEFENNDVLSGKSKRKLNELYIPFKNDSSLTDEQHADMFYKQVIQMFIKEYLSCDDNELVWQSLKEQAISWNQYQMSEEDMERYTMNPRTISKEEYEKKKRELIRERRDHDEEE